MPKGEGTKQTSETDISRLVEMAKEEIASGKVKYFSFDDDVKQAELNKIVMWIVEHSPVWRSNGSTAIREEMRRLGH